ncbi:hypothetical protein ACFLVB_00825 [Chloroflexota bacterium]
MKSTNTLGKFISGNWPILITLLVAIFALCVSVTTCVNDNERFQVLLGLQESRYEEIDKQYKESSELQEKRYEELNKQYENSIELQEQHYEELNKQYENSIELQEQHYEELNKQYENSIELQEQHYEELNKQYENSIELQEQHYAELVKPHTMHDEIYNRLVRLDRRIEGRKESFEDITDSNTRGFNTYEYEYYFEEANKLRNQAEVAWDGSFYSDADEYITRAFGFLEKLPSLLPEGGYTGTIDKTDSAGVFYNDYTVKAPDIPFHLTIKKGTIALTKFGVRLHSIIIIETKEPPAPPPNVNIVGLVYDIGPDGATFDPPITVTFTYDPSAVPASSNLIIAFWDEATGEWAKLENIVVDPSTNTISGDVSHFTSFAIIAVAAPTPPPPAPEPTPTPSAPVPTPTPVPEAGINWWLIGGIIVAVIILTLITWRMVSKGGTK